MKGKKRMINKGFHRFRNFNRKFRINRRYKDQLFRLIFNNKQDLLDLYNAVHATNYTDSDDLIITTINDAVYLGMKNDLSFLIANVLNLYEHQSTLNPNMPLRGLFYFSDVLRSYIETNHLDIYSKTLVSLPAPVYLIFYNGVDDAPDEMEYRLSDAFHDLPDGFLPALECRARMLNINLGHNKVLMQRCQKLNEYACFIARIRGFLDRKYPLEDAVNRAVDECIEEGILADILRKNRSEVINMILTDYDEKLHMQTVRKEGYEDGLKDGLEDGFKSGDTHRLKILIQKKLQKGYTVPQIADLLEEEPSTIKLLIDELKQSDK